jgi:hypothetical protein
MAMKTYLGYPMMHSMTFVELIGNDKLSNDVSNDATLHGSLKLISSLTWLYGSFS